ncbi:hypothetical protein AAFF_G00201460 [Aldrovandia affinis]|uniref:Uncharacterized protein n=1 Tax=Aldrovandia affinis TaxID=143900 RepID=A0AAD7SWT7_9TELE|nr:hypothetical protein AAFF_G00201460 [Aldrovandia affinis]
MLRKCGANPHPAFGGLEEAPVGGEESEGSITERDAGDNQDEAIPHQEDSDAIQETRERPLEDSPGAANGDEEYNTEAGAAGGMTVPGEPVPGGDVLAADLTTLYELVRKSIQAQEREDHKHKQWWRSVHIQLNQFRDELETERHAPSPDLTRKSISSLVTRSELLWISKKPSGGMLWSGRIDAESPRGRCNGPTTGERTNKQTHHLQRSSSEMFGSAPIDGYALLMSFFASSAGTMDETFH